MYVVVTLTSWTPVLKWSEVPGHTLYASSPTECQGTVLEASVLKGIVIPEPESPQHTQQGSPPQSWKLRHAPRRSPSALVPFCLGMTIQLLLHLVNSSTSCKVWFGGLLLMSLAQFFLQGSCLVHSPTFRWLVLHCHWMNYMSAPH